MELYKKNDRKFRLEIEGLRAIAAILVAIYHIWLGRVSGGVDIFFVIAGFLITLSILSRFEKNGKIDFLEYILNLAKRLFPAAFTVLFAVTIVCFFLLPELRWDQTVREVIASALYTQNWQLARNAVDYLAQHNEASPFQHFWAMSVQGQFYFIWPVLLLISIWLANNVFKIAVRSAFLLVLAMVFLISFGYSIYLTDVNQPWAYFDTFTRLWEFSMGGVLALGISKIVLSKSLSFFMGWIGFIGLITCGLILQVSNVFPGYAALWPTISAVFILIAGNQGGKFGVHRLLSSKQLLKFGGFSYGFYLWHWPILIFYYILSGKGSVGLVDGISIILLAYLLAYLTTQLIEKPIRKSEKLSSKLKTGIVVLMFLGSVLILSVGWYGAIKYLQTGSVPAANTVNYPGVEELTMDKEMEADVNYIPRPIQARNDLPKVYEDACHQSIGEEEVIECQYGETENPLYSLALVGGSHSAHWLPSIEEFAEKEKIKILSYTKSSCRFTTEETVEPDCKQWNEDVLLKLKSEKPDLVFTTADIGENLRPNIPAGFIDSWEQLEESNVKVLAIRDNPWFEFDIPTCVDENGVNASECTVERSQVVLKDSPWSKLDEAPANVHYVDFTDYFCADDCKPVIGNVLVYRDYNHITATYAKTLAPYLQEEVMSVLEKKEVGNEH